MRTSAAVGLALLLVVSALVTFAPEARAAGSPSLSVGPSGGIVGSNVSVNGSGFLNLSSVRITFNDSSGHSVQLCGACAVGASGTFAFTFAVPGATNGTAVVAVAEIGAAASANFTVVSHQTLSARSGAPLAAIADTFTGFDSAALTSFAFGPVVPGGTCNRRHTSVVGRFACVFDVPQLPYGSYPMVASDSGTNNASNTVLFAVVPGGDLFPDAGPVGSTVGLAVDGFPAYAPLSAIWDPSGADRTVVGTFLTGANGVASGPWTVPTAVFGVHTVSIVYSPSVVLNLSFSVVGALTASPASGYDGESGVRANGTGLPSAAPVDLVWDIGTAVSADLGTTTAGSLGTFSLTFTVPFASRGPHRLTAESGGTPYANGTFYVNASNLTLDRATAPPGGSFGASLRGFAASSAVNLVWDLGLSTQSLAANGTTNATGAASWGGLGVPSAVSAGPHTVTAIDASNDRAAATLTVGPWLTASPSSAPAGGNVVLSGWSFPAGAAFALVWNSSTGLPLASVPALTGASGYPYGNFSVNVTVPDDTVGPHTVYALEGAATIATTSVTIVPTLTLSGTRGTVGTPVVAVARGLLPASLAELRVDGVVVGPGAATGPNGTAVFAFALPPEAAGPHAYTVVDPRGDVTNPVTVTILPSIALASDSGFPGSTIELALAGFASDSVVTISWDGNGTWTRFFADVNGSAVGPFVLPNNTAEGTHAVGAWDGRNNSAAPVPLTVLDVPTPLLTGPDSGVAINRSWVTLSWGPVPVDGLTYSVVWSTDPTGLTGSSNVSGWPNASLTVDSLADGTYYWNVTAVAPGGEVSVSEDGWFSIDTVAPTSRAGPVASVVRGLSVDLPFTANDPAPSSGIAGVQLYYSVDGGFDWLAYLNGTVFGSSPIAFQPGRAGSYELQTVAVDRAGNRQPLEPAGQAVVLLDPVARDPNWAPVVFVLTAGALAIVGALLWPRGVPRPRPPMPAPQPKIPSAPAQPWQESSEPETPAGDAAPRGGARP